MSNNYARQTRLRICFTETHVSLLDTNKIPIITLFRGSKLANRRCFVSQDLLVFASGQIDIGQLVSLAESRCVKCIHLTFNKNNRESYFESSFTKSLRLSQKTLLDAAQNFFKPTIIVASCQSLGSSLSCLFSSACLLAFIHDRLIFRKYVPWDIDDCVAFVQLIPSVFRMPWLSGNWTEFIMKKYEMDSASDFSAKKDVSSLFDALTIHIKNLQKLENFLSSILEMVSQMDGERKHLIHDKSKLAFLSKLFISNVEDVNISLRIIQIFVELCEHDAQDARKGVQNLGICFQSAGTRSYLVQCTRNALISGRGELFGKICRLRQLFSLWRPIRCVDSPEMMNVFLNMIELIVQGLQNFINEPKVIVNMCGALATFLACHDNCKNKFIQLKGIPLILMVLQENAEEERVSQQGCQILNITAEAKVPEAEEMFQEKAGTHVVVLTCLTRFVNCVLLIEAACSFLIKMISKNPSSVRCLVQSGMDKVVKNVLSHYEGNALVEPLANKLVIMLSMNSKPDETDSDTTINDVRTRSRTRGSNSPGQIRLRAERSHTNVRVSRRSPQEPRDITRTSRTMRRAREAAR